MADMLANGIAWLEAQRTAHMTQSVTYQRGVDSVDVSATIGRTTFQVDRGFGVEAWEARDYLVLAADLVLAAAVTLPVAGDRVVEVAGGKAYTYEVMAPPGNEPVYRYSDDYRTTLRIHTKLVGVT